MGNEISQSVPADVVRSGDLSVYRLKENSHHKDQVYTKTQSYNRTQSDDKYRTKADSYTKLQTDNLAYSRTASDNKYRTKANSYAKNDVYTKDEANNRLNSIWAGSGVLETDTNEVGEFCFKHKSDPGYQASVGNMSHNHVACFDHIPAFLDPSAENGNFVMISSDHNWNGDYGDHRRLCGVSSDNGCLSVAAIKGNYPKCYLQFSTEEAADGSTTDQSMHICVKDGLDFDERRYVDNMNFLLQKEYMGLGRMSQSEYRLEGRNGEDQSSK